MLSNSLAAQCNISHKSACLVKSGLGYLYSALFLIATVVICSSVVCAQMYGGSQECMYILIISQVMQQP